MRISLPPVTKYSIIALVVLSTVAAVLRYSTYVMMVSDLNRILEEQSKSHSQQEIDDGRAYPPEPLLRSQIPRPGDLYVPYLTLVPGETPIFYPWVLISSTFVEPSIISFILTVSTLFYGAKYCEQIWGSMELSRFIGVLCIVPNLLSFGLYLVLHWIEGDAEVGETPSPVVTICGGTALVAGFLVAFKQLVPEHTVVLFKGRIKFKVKRIPVIFLTVVTFCGIFGSGLYSVLAWLGFFTSWVYLRFFRIAYTDPMLPFNNSPSSIGPVVSYEHNNPSGIKIRGDASDSFAMHTFFPEPFNFIAQYISGPAYKLLVGLGVVNPFSQSEIESANFRAASKMSSMMPGASSFVAFGRDLSGEGHHSYPRDNNREEAERRRSMALRALDRESVRLPSPLAVHSKVRA